MSVHVLSRQESKTDVFAIKKQTRHLKIRKALDRYLKAPPYNKRFSICDKALFSEAYKTLNSCLKQLVKQGRIAATVNKISLAVHAIKGCMRKANLHGDAPTAPAVYIFYNNKKIPRSENYLSLGARSVHAFAITE